MNFTTWSKTFFCARIPLHWPHQKKRYISSASTATQWIYFNNFNEIPSLSYSSVLNKILLLWVFLFWKKSNNELIHWKKKTYWYQGCFYSYLLKVIKIIVFLLVGAVTVDASLHSVGVVSKLIEFCCRNMISFHVWIFILITSRVFWWILQKKKIFKNLLATSRKQTETWINILEIRCFV